MPQKIVVRLELSKAAKDQLEKISERTGMTQVSTGSRLFEWFARQSELIHGAVLSQYPKEVQHEIACIILSHFAGDKKK